MKGVWIWGEVYETASTRGMIGWKNETGAGGSAGLNWPFILKEDEYKYVTKDTYSFIIWLTTFDNDLPRFEALVAAINQGMPR